MQQASRMIFFMGILLVVCVFFSENASAASGANSDIIANIVNKYREQSQQIISVTTKYSQNLFGLCVVLEIAWLGVNAALGRADMGDVIKKFCITLVVCGFFLAVINNFYPWTQQVVNGLQDIAGEAVGSNDSSDLAFKKGLQLCNDILTLIKSIDWDDIGLILLWVLILLIVLVIFCMIAARVIVYKCEALIAMAASCILLGFGGSSVMREFAMNTLRYILSVGFKLFTMQMAEKYNIPRITLTEDAKKIMLKYKWPGNVRQLKNITEQMSVLSTEREIDANTIHQFIPEDPESTQLAMIPNQGGAHSYENERELLYKILYELRGNVSEMRREMNDMRKKIDEAGKLENATPYQQATPYPTTMHTLAPAEQHVTPYGMHDMRQQNRVEDVEVEEIKDSDSLNLNDLGRQMVERALEKNGGNRKKAAAELGISDRTLYRRIKQYGLDK